ncbi:MAG: hypothetical protein ACLFN8_00355 [Candidatus Woesearchaeota archaeon]
MRQAQAAYEFMMIFFILTLGFTFWIAFSTSFQENLQQQQNLDLMEDFAFGLKHELFVVAQMPQGFTQIIELTETISGNKYEIASQSYTSNDYNFSTITINNTDIGFYTHFDVPYLNDTIKKGKNTFIKKENQIGVIHD